MFRCSLAGTLLSMLSKLELSKLDLSKLDLGIVRDEAATFGYPRARSFEQRVKDLWLSATGAVLNGG
jgi:hypothetical protein